MPAVAATASPRHALSPHRRRGARPGAGPTGGLSLAPLGRALAAAGLLAGPLQLQAAGPLPPPAAVALPSGHQLAAGQAAVQTVGANMVVKNAPGTILDWRSFNIGAAASVRFDQADAASRVLNRVSGSDPSRIFGSLSSNGQVWLVNPNGVLFGAGARVDVAGLVASTLRLGDNDFLAQRFHFSDGASGGAVRNLGDIRTVFGGQVLLLGREVENAGSIVAPGGQITLAAGQQVDLVDTGLPHLQVRLQGGAGGAAAAVAGNLGMLVADGGSVDIYGGIVNQAGLVQADALRADAQGRIRLQADTRLTLGEASTTQARGLADGSTGGRIDLLGPQIALTGQALVDASGQAGGGALRIGGGLQGRDSSVPNAQALWIGPQVQVRADATGPHGNGGSIIAWSDDATRVYGSFSARAGLLGGDGGFLETSGGWIDAQPLRVDLASPAGLAGTWLLDPFDLVITSGTINANISSGPTFTATDAPAVLGTAVIAATLNAGTSVTVRTGTGGGNGFPVLPGGDNVPFLQGNVPFPQGNGPVPVQQAGDILMVNAALAVAPPSAVTLRLEAHRDIVVRNSSVRSDGAPLHVELAAAGNGLGVIDIENSQFATAGGSVLLGGTLALQQPLGSFGFTADVYRAAQTHVPGGLPTAARQNARAGVLVTGSSFDLGAGSFTAIGATSLDNSDAVRIGDNGSATLIRAGDVTLRGYAAAGVSSGVVDNGGVMIQGERTDIVAAGSVTVEGAGVFGVAMENGARITLNGNGTGQLRLRGWGRDWEGLILSSQDLDTNTVAPGSRGSRVTVRGASASFEGTSSGTAGLVLLDTGAPPGPLLDLAGATSAALVGIHTTAALQFGISALTLRDVELQLPDTGATSIESNQRLDLQSVAMGWGSGQVSLRGQGVVAYNSLLLGGSGALLLASAGTTPTGVQLRNTTVVSNGDILLGETQQPPSAALGQASFGTGYAVHTLGGAGLVIDGSSLDAGAGRILGGGASAFTGQGQGGNQIPQQAGIGVDLRDAVLVGREVRLAGRSDLAIGTLVQGSNLRASTALVLEGESAGDGAGLHLGTGNLVSLRNPAPGTDGLLWLNGIHTANGTGLLLTGGAVGGGRETRIVADGASLWLTGQAGVGGIGAQLAGDFDQPGGLLVDGKGATRVLVTGTVANGDGTGLLVEGATLLGANADSVAGSALELQGNGRAAISVLAAGLRVGNSLLTAGGSITLQGDAIALESSEIAGDAGISLLSQFSTGPDAPGPIRVGNSVLRTTAPGAVLRVEAASGAAATGDRLFDNEGIGIVVVGSLVQASGSNSLVRLRGQGAADGGTGLLIDASTVSAHRIELTGTGQVHGHGVVLVDVSALSTGTLIGHDIDIQGQAANSPAPGEAPDKVGVVLGGGNSVQVTGGSVSVLGDTVLLGSADEDAEPFIASGSAQGFSVSATGSLKVVNSLLDFEGSAPQISLVANADGLNGGRVRLQGVTVRSSGGGLVVSGQGVVIGNGQVPGHRLVSEGFTGVLVQDTSITLGGGSLLLTGQGPAADGLAPDLGGFAGVGFSGNVQLRAGTVEMQGHGGANGTGVDIGRIGTSTQVEIVADSVILSGTGIGVDPNTGVANAGVTIQGPSTINANTVLLAGTGIDLQGTRIDSTGALSINAGGAVLVRQATLRSGNFLAITADNAPLVPTDGAVTLVDTAIGGLDGAAPDVAITGRSATAQPGVLLGGGNTVSAAALQIVGSSQLGVGLVLDTGSAGGAPLLSGNLVSLVGRTGAPVPGLAATGGWRVASAGSLDIDVDNGFRLLPGTDALTPQALAGQGVRARITATQGFALDATDAAAISSAFAGLPADQPVRLEIDTPVPALVQGQLLVPGRLEIAADGLRLMPGAVLQGGASGDALVLQGRSSAGMAQLVNNAGASALRAPNGRWVVLAQQPGTVELGGAAQDFTAYGLGSQPWSTDPAGNLLAPAPGNALAFTTSLAELNGGAPGDAALVGALTKTYDASRFITLDADRWQLGGLAPGDMLTLSGTTTALLPDKNVGSGLPVALDAGTVFTVNDSQGRPVFGYGAPAFTATVQPLAVSLTGLAVRSRDYDGSTQASLSSLGSVAALPGDRLAVGGDPVARFIDRHAGTAKPVLLSGLQLTGADAGNYTLQAPSSTTADITPRPLQVAGLQALGKVYDRSDVAQLTGNATVDSFAIDAVALAGDARGSFADRQAGTGKPVSVSGLRLTGPDAGNYSLQPVQGLAADITPAPLALAGLAALDKVYDGSRQASVSGSASVSPLAGDVVTLSGTVSANFADKAAASGKPVTLAGIGLDGADAANYSLQLPALSASITPAPLLLQGLVVDAKVYDGNTLASIGSLGSVATLPGDRVAVGGNPAAQFADRHAGTAKPVLLSGLQLTGDDAGNYTLQAPTGTTADITPRPLQVGGLQALGKVYDRSDAATLTGSPTVATFAIDAVALDGSASGRFADRQAGSGKPVSVSGLRLTGPDAGNYSLQPVQGLAADITPAPLLLSGLAALDKVYDGSRQANLSGSASVSPLGGDVVTLAGTASANFADKAAGSGKPVTLAGIDLDGADAANYRLQLPALGASITPAPLLLQGLVVNAKIYDGNTQASFGNPGRVAALAGDDVAISGSPQARFVDRQAGTAKPVLLSGLTLTGADAGNYTLQAPAGTTADITPRPLQVTGLQALGKVYDGSAAAPLAGSPAVAALGADAVALVGQAGGSFADKNAGTAKPVSVSGLSLSGADAGNYSLQPVQGLAADITPAPLPLSGLAAQDKVYDGNARASLAGTASIAPVAGDRVLLAGTASASFADKAAGSGKPVTLAGIGLAGADAANYSLQLPGLSASITPAPLLLQGLAVDAKAYDGSTAATARGSLAGVLAGDGVALDLAARFANADAGPGKLVDWSAALLGADAPNYRLAGAQVGTLQADISPGLLQYLATPARGTVGQPLPLLTGSLQGLVGGDTLATATTGTLAWGSNALAGSAAGLYGVFGSGLQARNYLFEQAPGNAQALTLQAATPGADATSTITAVATARTLMAVQVPVAMSTPTQGRVLDVTAALAPAPAPDQPPGLPPAGDAAALLASQVRSLSARLGELGSDGNDALGFAEVDLSRLPRDEVASLLAARARYKAKVFSKGVYSLQQDPTLADARACRTETELSTGACIVTEQLKQEIRAAQLRAVQVKEREDRRRKIRQAALPVIERKLALVIGINIYNDKRVPRLTGAVPDARAVRTLLEQRLGYEATVLENPGREAIVKAFNRLALDAQPGDSVIVYFAGHGVLVPIDGVETGFWLPSDVNSDQPGTWLPNADIARMVAAVGARQVMLVSDSCYSGRLVGRERVQTSSTDADDLLKRRAVVVMSSGGDEPVADLGRGGHSVFAWHFMRALEGLSAWQPGNNLYAGLRDAVAKDFPQTPQYGASRAAGHEGGTDYLFERREIDRTQP